MAKPLSALLIKKIGTKLVVTGPKFANQLSTITDIDLVLLLCDHAEMIKPEHTEELHLFNICTANSKMAEESTRPIKHIRTVSYMLGSILTEEIRDFFFDGLEYQGTRG